MLFTDKLCDTAAVGLNYGYATCVITDSLKLLTIILTILIDHRWSTYMHGTAKVFINGLLAVKKIILPWPRGAVLKKGATCKVFPHKIMHLINLSINNNNDTGWLHFKYNYAAFS